MHLVAQQRVSDSAVVDVVALHDEGSLLVSALDGSLTVLDARDASVRARLRGPEVELATAGILAVERDRVVVWGWEVVEAIELSTGTVLWHVADGDHSLDEVAGGRAATPASPYVVLPNGEVRDTRDGALHVVEGDRDLARGLLPEPVAFVVDAAHGLVVASGDGALLRWAPARERAPRRDLTRLPCAARALVWRGDDLVAACADGAVYRVDARDCRALTPPRARPGDTVMAAHLAALDGGLAVAWEFEMTGYVARHVVERVGPGDGAEVETLLETTPARIAGNHLTWAYAPRAGALVALLGGRLRAWEGRTPIEVPALPDAVTAMLGRGLRVVLGDARGTVSLLEATP